ncbi:MAG: EAL domain-containing protein [Betaproteobacteria bacterium]|nr:MAG: EAL domain-containing protein [Betaproteobacteria bacterium]
MLQLAESVPVMLAVFDAKSLRCLYTNSQYAQLGQQTPAQIVGKTLAEILGPELSTLVLPYAHTSISSGEPVSYTRTVTDASGPRHLEVSFVPVNTSSRLYVLANDISKHRLAEQALEQSMSRLHKFMAASEEGIAFHIDGMITDVNQALLRMLGYASDEMVGHSTLEFVPESEHDRVKLVIAKRDEIAYESLALHKTRGAIPVEFIVRDIVWAGVKQRMVIVRDISERRATLERIRYLALNDSLSGLPNRAALDEHLRLLMKAKPAVNFAVLFLDVDQLKRINDSLGHAAGDALLIETAGRLARLCATENAIDQDAWLSRIGGDEFVLTLRNPNEATLDSFVSRIEAAFDAPYFLNGRKIKASASIGVALYPSDGEDSNQLLKNADAAMYAAKASGRRTVRYFDQALARAADAMLEIEQDLASAIQTSQFELFFQPIMSSDGRELISAEALLRWNHPNRGLIMPNEFIHIAEESNLFLPIGQWVLEHALREVKDWIALGWEHARVAVNLSNNEVRADDFVAEIIASLRRTEIAGEHLELELTERMLMSQDNAIRDALLRLQSEGIKLSIDDFGTGYSSLSRLSALPIDTLKIDQSFVAELPESHTALAIVTALLQLCRGLTIDVVAEGVERADQRDCLQLLGCDAMQGFLFSRAMTASDFKRWLSELLSEDDWIQPRISRKRRAN